jgi:transcriptional regulator with XRE-family HTH domain
MKLNEKLKTLRLHHGYSQQKLAEKMYISRQAVAKWENGDSIPDYEHLKKIAEIYEMKVDDIMDESIDVFASFEVKETMKITKLLIIICITLGILMSVLTFTFQLGFIKFFIVPGMLLMIILTLVGVFSHAIKTNDYSILAGFDEKKSYNYPQLKKMMLTIENMILISAIITLLLYSLNFLVEGLSETAFNVILLLTFCFNMIVWIAVINKRYKLRIYK